MNKEQEIKALRLFVKHLGVDSYTGPWLRDQLPCIEQAITNDVNPSCYALTLKEAQNMRAEIIQTARVEADAISDRCTEAQQALENRRTALSVRISAIENMIAEFKEKIRNI